MAGESVCIAVVYCSSVIVIGLNKRSTLRFAVHNVGLGKTTGSQLHKVSPSL